MNKSVYKSAIVFVAGFAVGFIVGWRIMLPPPVAPEQTDATRR